MTSEVDKELTNLAVLAQVVLGSAGLEPEEMVVLGKGGGGEERRKLSRC